MERGKLFCAAAALLAHSSPNLGEIQVARHERLFNLKELGLHGCRRRLPSYSSSQVQVGVYSSRKVSQ